MVAKEPGAFDRLPVATGSLASVVKYSWIERAAGSIRMHRTVPGSPAIGHRPSPLADPLGRPQRRTIAFPDRDLHQPRAKRNPSSLRQPRNLLAFGTLDEQNAPALGSEVVPGCLSVCSGFQSLPTDGWQP